jgi:transposase-like protein
LNLGNVINKLELLIIAKKDVTYPRNLMSVLPREGLTKKWQKNLTGIQQWRCKSCKKYFQLAYKYTARKSGIKDKIIEMTLNNSGVRDIGRVLKISKDTRW